MQNENKNKDIIHLNKNNLEEQLKKEEKEIIKLPLLINKEDIDKSENESEANSIEENNSEKIYSMYTDINLLTKKRERDSFDKGKGTNEDNSDEEDEKTEKTKKEKIEIKKKDKNKDKIDTSNYTNNNKKIENKKDIKEVKIGEKKQIKNEEKKEEKGNIKINNNQNNIDKNKNNTNNINTNINKDHNTNNEKGYIRITFKEAQKSIKEFMELLLQTEEKIKAKYGNCLPDFSCEEQLPLSWQKELVIKFFECDEMKNIANKVKEEQDKK